MNTETIKSFVRDGILPGLLGLFLLTLPWAARAGQADCLFDWAEANYPSLFAPSGASTAVWSSYMYRYYSATRAYLGVSSTDNHVYYLGPDGNMQDVGPLADWTPKAGCQAPPPPPECLFNWAERNYPGLFAPAGFPTAVWSVYTYRYYSSTLAYLGVSSVDTHVYYRGPDGNMQDVGPLAEWTPKACQPPLANAGADQTAAVGATVTLDGSASSDPDGDLITYQWTLAQKPADSQTALLNPATLRPSLAIDKPGSYVVSLVVNDGLFDSAPARVTVNTQNSKPVANAGAAQSGKLGDTLVLDGSASRDIDGDALTYSWILPGKPQGSGAALKNPNTISPTLTLDKPGSYTAQLTVNDGKADSAPATVVLTTLNAKPVAEAGPAQSLPLTVPATPVLLDGGASSDADGDPLGFRWALISKPAGSQSALTDPASPSTRFTPDFVGDYVAQLIVNDGHADSDPDTVPVSVTAPPPPQNHPPQITSKAPATATEGQAYSYAVTATDSDGDTLVYSLPGAPGGMAITAGSGLVQWTPGAGDVGTHPVTVKVDDSKGGADSQFFQLTVQALVNPVNVPALAGLSRSAAENAVRQAKLNLGAASFEHNNTAAEGIVLRQSPLAGTQANLGSSVDLTVSLGPDAGLPPNPATVAPPVGQTVATTVADASRFLYRGAEAVQTLADGSPLADGAIEAKRAAVLRGQVLDKQNNPLPGVTVAVLSHQELGQTLSRADGGYDLAVNGGGTLTVDYRKTGYLSAQRQVDAPWQDYVPVGDVVLIGRDAAATAIDFSGSAPMQVAQGSPSSDGSGLRKPTLLIPQGVTARVYNPDGSTRAVGNLTLRLTEFTVGGNGPAAMPAPLPPTSVYTYAVELSADEATTAIAGKSVLFNQPVYFYLENFLGFPVGMQVPVGWYDRGLGAWVPSDDGKVLKILGSAGGLAVVDSDGDNHADDAAILAALGMGDAERSQLAVLYPAGATLWRVGVDHFTPLDCNLPSLWPVGAVAPAVEGATVATAPVIDNGGGFGGWGRIDPRNQSLTESLPLVGTPFALTYASHRAGAAVVTVPLTGTTVPAPLQKIVLEIDVAGRRFLESLNPPFSPNQNYTFTWDGKDAYGRDLKGAQALVARVGYVYQTLYAMPQTLWRSFGLPGGDALPGNLATRDQGIRWRESTVAVTERRPSSAALGEGWDVSVHHHYDPTARTLDLGDGRRRSVEAARLSALAHTLSGHDGIHAPLNDGGPALLANYQQISGLAVAADGNTYIADAARIRRIGPDGAISTVAGTGQSCAGSDCGDGGPALNAKILPGALALGPDSSLYFADSSTQTIRRVGPDGIITRFAGTGGAGYNGDGIPATSANLSPLYATASLAVAPDGTVFMVDHGNNARWSIRRIDTGGIITTYAGNGSTCPLGQTCGDGGKARDASMRPFSLAVAPDGSVLLYEGDATRLRRVRTDGIVENVAGRVDGGNGECDECPAQNSHIGYVASVAVDRAGNLYLPDATVSFSQSRGNRIRRISPDGIIHAYAGTGGFVAIDATTPDLPQGGLSPTVKLHYPRYLALKPDGALLAGEYSRIWQLQPLLPGYDGKDVLIPSEDAREIYRFDAQGRHLDTRDALTQGLRYAFGYDGAGRLSSITDGSGNATTIRRDALGAATAVVGPYGQATRLALDGNLAEVTSPAGERTRFAYTSDGILLSKITAPRGGDYLFGYDAGNKLLVSASDPAGGGVSFARLAQPPGYRVTRGTTLGHDVLFDVNLLANGDRILSDTWPDGRQFQATLHPDGGSRRVRPEGTVTERVAAADPRFGAAALYDSAITTATPGGQSRVVQATRAATLADPLNVANMAQLAETLTVGGKIWTRLYDAASRTFTLTSPAGRLSTLQLDALGRPVRQQQGGLQALDFSYDSHGRPARLAWGSRSVDLAYVDDPLSPRNGWLQSMTDNLGRALGLEQDAAGRINKLTYPNGGAMSIAYDAHGNPATVATPANTACAFDYSVLDLLSAVRCGPPTGPDFTGYSYDAERKPLSVTRPEGALVSFGYDAFGRPATVAMPDRSLTYSYDAQGRVAGLLGSDGQNLALSYDGHLLDTETWSGTVAGSVGRSYDSAFRIKTLNVAGTVVGFAFDGDGLLIQAGAEALARDANNGLVTGITAGATTETLSRNAYGEVDGTTLAGNAAILYTVAYSRDAAGRISGFTATPSPPESAKAIAFGYDSAGRLAEVKLNGSIIAAYTYDANGNRLSGPGAPVGTVSYDGQERLTQYGTVGYTYTAGGALASQSEAGVATVFEYDGFGNLIHASRPGKDVRYILDGLGRRVGKQVDGSLVQGFLYGDALHPVAELDGAGQVVSRFIYGSRQDTPDLMIRNGIAYRILSDYAGSPRVVVNTADGSLAQRMDYDEFGNVLNDTAPGFQPFGFAGGLYDSHTRLVHFGAREYDPRTGRFTRPDPARFAAGANLYAYVHGDPVNRTDPTGLGPGQHPNPAIPPHIHSVDEDPFHLHPNLNLAFAQEQAHWQEEWQQEWQATWALPGEMWSEFVWWADSAVSDLMFGPSGDPDAWWKNKVQADEEANQQK